MNEGLCYTCEAYPTEPTEEHFGEVGSGQALWTKSCLLLMHVLEMVGLTWHALSAKAYRLSRLVRNEALIVVLFATLDLCWTSGGSRRDHRSDRFTDGNHTFIVQRACMSLIFSLSVEPRSIARNEVTQVANTGTYSLLF